MFSSMAVPAMSFRECNMGETPMLREFQFLRPDGHDGERPGLVLLQVRVDALKRDAVDGVLDLVERADSAADEEVVRDRAGAGGSRLALHDCRGFQSGL